MIIDVYSNRGNAENDARFIVNARQIITDLIQVTREVARHALDAKTAEACISCLHDVIAAKDEEIRKLRRPLKPDYSCHGAKCGKCDVCNLDFPAAVKQLEEAIEVARAKTTAEEK